MDKIDRLAKTKPINEVLKKELARLQVNKNLIKIVKLVRLT